MLLDIVSHLGVTVKDAGFSLDELVYRLKSLCEEKALPELIAYVLMIYDEILRIHVMTGRPIPFTCQCGHKDFVLDGKRPRTIKTVVGEVRLPSVQRVKCRKCGKSMAPLLRICGLEDHQSKTDGVEKMVLEECVQTSYRRAAKSLAAKTAVSGGKSTFHRWVLETDADEISIPEDTLASVPDAGGRLPEPVTVFADGTKCKARSDDGKAAQGNIRVMVAIRKNGEVFPVGTWTKGESWEQIGESLRERSISFPDGSVLVCDGEPGLAEALSEIATEHQRCQWHIARDLYFAMHRDGANSQSVGPYQQRLWRTMSIELPSEDFDVLSDEAKAHVKDRLNAAEKSVDDLVQEIRKGGFAHAAKYLEQSRDWIFAYVRRWLALGISCPRASSFIERTMRELGRRIKKLAYGWKETGLGKVTNLLLKIFASEKEWEKYWLDRMNIRQAVALTFRIDKNASRICSSPKLGQ